MSRPLSVTRPVSGSSNPAIMRSEVVLPQPDGPSSEKNSPRATSMVTLSTAATLPKRLVTPYSPTSTSGAVLVAVMFTRRLPARLPLGSYSRPGLGEHTSQNLLDVVEFGLTDRQRGRDLHHRV